MGTFKYRENPGAPWQELSVIGDISTGSSAFSTDTHDTIIINQSKRDNSTGYYTWLDWKDYITDLDSIELLILYYGFNSYYYVKGIVADRTDNVFPAMRAYYNSSQGKTTVSDIGNTIEFSDAGVKLYSPNGDIMVPSVGATIYSIKKKEG